LIFSYLFDLFFLIVSVQKPLFKLCKTNFDMAHIEEEKKHYVPLPKKYCFENEHEKEVLLARNFRRINEEVKQMTASLLGKEAGD